MKTFLKCSLHTKAEVRPDFCSQCKDWVFKPGRSDKSVGWLELGKGVVAAVHPGPNRAWLNLAIEVNGGATVAFARVQSIEEATQTIERWIANAESKEAILDEWIAMDGEG